ncbi:hypothetical protein [Streptomyces winkii]|uniref:hypothetical protein n=1 Tax=Streptomyces winkii TaxID=3051178 RepID=UPI0028D8DD49|nr:hypothetical protein [Streptomyces sp. DSM 40971]
MNLAATTVATVLTALATAATVAVSYWVGKVTYAVQERSNAIQDEAVDRQAMRDYFDMRDQAASVSFVRFGPSGPDAGAAVITNRSADPLPHWGLVYKAGGGDRLLLQSHTAIRPCNALKLNNTSASEDAARAAGAGSTGGSVKLRGFYFQDRYGRIWERNTNGRIVSRDKRLPEGRVTDVDPNRSVTPKPDVANCGNEE